MDVNISEKIVKIEKALTKVIIMTTNSSKWASDKKDIFQPTIHK